MRKVFSLVVAALVGLALVGADASAQSLEFQTKLTIQSASVTDTLAFGVRGDGPGGAILDNTYDLDTNPPYPADQAEDAAAPAPPTINFRAKWGDVPGRPARTGGAQLKPRDFRGFTSPATVDTFQFNFEGTQALGTVTITWDNAQLGANVVAARLLQQDFTSTYVERVADMTSAGTYVQNPGSGFANYLIIVSGYDVAVPGPLFAASPSPLNFGNVAFPGSANADITVSNAGATNPLNISSVVSDAAEFTVSPASAVVPAGGSQVFQVTFTPSSEATFNGNITFTHDAPGSPSVVPVSGSASSVSNILRFEQDTVNVLDRTTYTETLRLQYQPTNGAALKSLSFVLTPSRPLILESIAKGADIQTGNWRFDVQIDREPADGAGDAVDTIRVVLFAQDLATGLAAGSDYEIATFQYRIDNIDTPADTAEIGMTGVVGSDALGNNQGTTADAPYVALITNRTIAGDVNGSGNVDIVDALLIVEHIQQRRLLTAEEFVRADVAPWADFVQPVDPDSIGDGTVDATDLALVNNIALTGQYPNGQVLGRFGFTPIAVASTAGSLEKADGITRVTFHMTVEGVAVRVETAERIKGIQFDLEKVSSVPDDMRISTILGDGYFNVNRGEQLRAMVYDAQGASLDAGTYLIANLPFRVEDPSQLTVTDLILVNENLEKVGDLQVLISLETAPEIPLVYALEQNYPNPFNPTTDIQFTVPEAGDVRITIYNSLGQEVRSLFSSQVERGTRVVRWDGRSNTGSILPSGTYFYRMAAGSFVETKKMMLLK